MLPSTDLYKSVLHGPHKRVAYITATDIDGNVLAENVPVVAGSVRSSLTDRVTRSASFTLDDSWFPRTALSAFSPYQSVVHITAGTGYGDGTEETFPIFTGRVWDVSRSPGGSVDFRADDLAADVVGARFEAPEKANTSNTILAEIRRLILGGLPQATFGTDTVMDAGTPVLTWDEDRGQALDDLAAAVGGRWYALGDGRFVVAPFNYTLGTVQQTFIDGIQGLMSTATVSQTRDGSANSIVVVAERLDGSDPVRVIARDLAPSSPTMFGGRFGRVVQIIKMQTPLSVSEAQTLAATQLGAATALTEQWTSNVVPDYTIEPGDTVRLGYRGYSADQILDGVTYPLGTDSAMVLTSRSAGAPAVTEA